MYFLGVDGGGTKTSFCLISPNTKPLYYSTSTCYINDIGEENVYKVFQEFGDILAQNNLTYNDISHSFLGMPGFTESVQWDQQIIKILDKVFGDKYYCDNDAVAGWAGSLACEPGINVIAGTGTISFGINHKGEAARSGGWGPTIGDEGSGHWLGRKALEIFSKQSDGRLNKTIFHQLFIEHTGLKKDEDLIDLVYNQWNDNRTKIASLSKIVYEAALQNDPYALEIIDETAKEIALMIRALLGKLYFEGNVKISYSGGVFSMGEILLTPLRKFLEEYKINCELASPKFDPSEGAALYAAKLYCEKSNDSTNIYNSLVGTLNI